MPRHVSSTRSECVSKGCNYSSNPTEKHNQQLGRAAAILRDNRHESSAKGVFGCHNVIAVELGKHGGHDRSAGSSYVALKDLPQRWAMEAQGNDGVSDNKRSEVLQTTRQQFTAIHGLHAATGDMDGGLTAPMRNRQRCHVIALRSNITHPSPPSRPSAHSTPGYRSSSLRRSLPRGQHRCL